MSVLRPQLECHLSNIDLNWLSLIYFSQESAAELYKIGLDDYLSPDRQKKENINLPAKTTVTLLTKDPVINADVMSTQFLVSQVCQQFQFIKIEIKGARNWRVLIRQFSSFMLQIDQSDVFSQILHTHLLLGIFTIFSNVRSSSKERAFFLCGCGPL